MKKISLDGFGIWNDKGEGMNLKKFLIYLFLWEFPMVLYLVYILFVNEIMDFFYNNKYLNEIILKVLYFATMFFPFILCCLSTFVYNKLLIKIFKDRKKQRFVPVFICILWIVEVIAIVVVLAWFYTDSDYNFNRVYVSLVVGIMYVFLFVIKLLYHIIVCIYKCIKDKAA